MTEKKLKAKEIAQRINTHLKRFEADPVINVRAPGMLLPFYNAGAYLRGSRIGVTYVSFQGTRCLSTADALKYLNWLDAGNVGNHYKALPWL